MSDNHWYAGRRWTIEPAGAGGFLAGLNDQPWATDALCAQTDPEAFYPEKGGSTRGAKAVCGACDVRDDCLAYALEHGERWGIWGGPSERERRRLIKVPDAQPRLCARAACGEIIPAAADPSRRYHDGACRRIAREEDQVAALNHDQILDAYLVDHTPIGRIAARHHVQPGVIMRLLDQHGINHTRVVSAARRRAARSQEAS